MLLVQPIHEDISQTLVVALIRDAHVERVPLELVLRQRAVHGVGCSLNGADDQTSTRVIGAHHQISRVRALIGSLRFDAREAVFTRLHAHCVTCARVRQ